MDPSEILEHTRQLIREHAGDDPDKWWYANRFVFARLQLDERKTKTGIKKALISAGQACHACSEAFQSTKGIHLHRLDGSKAYRDGNCVLMHGDCHQKWHAEQADEAANESPALGRPPTLIKRSKRYDDKPFLYWWDITPNYIESVDDTETIQFVCKDTGERCLVALADLLTYLTPERRTSRGQGNWGIKVLNDRPDELALEPPTGSTAWVFLAVTCLAEDKED